MIKAIEAKEGVIYMKITPSQNDDVDERVLTVIQPFLDDGWVLGWWGVLSDGTWHARVTREAGAVPTCDVTVWMRSGQGAAMFCERCTDEHDECASLPLGKLDDWSRVGPWVGKMRKEARRHQRLMADTEVKMERRRKTKWKK